SPRQSQNCWRQTEIGLRCFLESTHFLQKEQQLRPKQSSVLNAFATIVLAWHSRRYRKQSRKRLRSDASIGPSYMSLRCSNSSDSQQVILLGRCREPVPERGVRQCDQSLCSLRRGEPLQIGNAVFGNYVVNIGARCCYRTRESRHNFADLALLDRRLEGDERHSSLGRIGTSDKVELSAGGSELMAPHVFRVAGSRQVHFNR